MAAALIHYFSGTGNTARVIHLIADGLRKADYHVEIHNIEDGKRNQIGYDLQIFAFPVYAMAPPAVMLRYLRQSAPGDGVKTGIIAVWGELDATGKVPGWEGQALEQAKRVLERRGYTVFFTDGVGYPESFTAILKTPTIEERVKITAVGEEKVKTMVERLVNQESSLRRCNLPNQIWSRLVFYLYTLLGRRMMGKMYIADDQCNGCGKCARTCPVGSIHMVHHQPRWNFACEGCQRCINICPESAIQTSTVRGLWAFAVIFLPYGRWARALFPIPQWGTAADLLFGLSTWILGLILTFFLLDFVLFQWGKIPGVKKVLSVAHTRKFLRYIEPHFKPHLKGSADKRA